MLYFRLFYLSFTTLFLDDDNFVETVVKFIMNEISTL